MPGLAQFVAWNQVQTSAALLSAALAAGFWLLVWGPSREETHKDVSVTDAHRADAPQHPSHAPPEGMIRALTWVV